MIKPHNTKLNAVMNSQKSTRSYELPRKCLFKLWTDYYAIQYHYYHQGNSSTVDTWLHYSFSM